VTVNFGFGQDYLYIMEEPIGMGHVLHSVWSTFWIDKLHGTSSLRKKNAESIFRGKEFGEHVYHVMVSPVLPYLIEKQKLHFCSLVSNDTAFYEVP